MTDQATRVLIGRTHNHYELHRQRRAGRSKRWKTIYAVLGRYRHTSRAAATADVIRALEIREMNMIANDAKASGMTGGKLDEVLSGLSEQIEELKWTKP